MDMHQRLSDTVRSRERYREQQYLQVSREKLKDYVDAQLKTLFIGALSIFEERFGELWKHGDLPITKKQKRCRAKWNEARTAILDDGHKRIRILRNVIDRYTVRFNQPETKLKVRKNNG